MTYLPDGDYIVLSDMQIPYHDRRLVALVCDFVEAYRPDGLLCVGDEADSPEPSQWSKGMAGEYADTLEDGLRQTHEVMRAFALALNANSTGGPKPFIVSRSNHTDRIQKYLARYAPAMSRTSWNQYPTILGYDMQRPSLPGCDPLPITFARKPVPFAKGWLMMHGDEGSMIQSAGGTALNLAKRTGSSVVCGHTHRAGLQHHNLGHSGRITHTLFGLEVGHLMDLKKASYLKSGAANWQAAFAILHIRRGVVHPELVPIQGHRFTVHGEQSMALDLTPEEIALADGVARGVGRNWARVPTEDVVADLRLWLCENHRYVHRYRGQGQLGRNRLRLSLRRRANKFCRGEFEVVKPFTSDFQYTTEAVTALLEALFAYPDWSDISPDGDSDVWASLTDASQAYESLNATDRALLKWRLGAGLRFTEIAEELDLPSPDAARMRVNRALGRVAERASRGTVRWGEQIWPLGGRPWNGEEGAIE